MTGFRDFFTFSKRERSGILVLLSLILLVITANQLAGVFYQPETNNDIKAFKKEIEAFEKNTVPRPAFQNGKKNKPYSNKKKPLANPVDFDPNSASFDELVAAGLSAKNAKTIIRYREKGGMFSVPSDLKKIYGISDSLFIALEPYIIIEQKPQLAAEMPVQKKHFSKTTDINLADTSELKRLYGIGDILAARVVAYRESLGGFYTQNQLLEVYGMPADIFENNKDKIICTPLVKKININSASEEELKKHPYIKWRLASVIVNYRTKHGDYQDIEEVKKTDLVPAELYPKLAPYLTLQ